MKHKGVNWKIMGAVDYQIAQHFDLLFPFESDLFFPDWDFVELHILKNEYGWPAEWVEMWLEHSGESLDELCLHYEGLPEQENFIRASWYDLQRCSTWFLLMRWHRQMSERARRTTWKVIEALGQDKFIELCQMNGFSWHEITEFLRDPAPAKQLEMVL